MADREDDHREAPAVEERLPRYAAVHSLRGRPAEPVGPRSYRGLPIANMSSNPQVCRPPSEVPPVRKRPDGHTEVCAHILRSQQPIELNVHSHVELGQPHRSDLASRVDPAAISIASARAGIATESAILDSPSPGQTLAGFPAGKPAGTSRGSPSHAQC